LDSACQEHDSAYAVDDSDLLRADVVLAKKALAQPDPIGWLISIGITGQALLRYIGVMPKKNKSKKNPSPQKTAEVKSMLKTVAHKEKALSKSVERRLPAATLPHLPKQQTKIKTRNDMNECVMSGTEILGTVTLLSSTAVGDVIFSKDVCPQNVSSSRIQVLSNIFERYDPQQWEIEFIPQQGTAIAGNIVMAFDPDVSDDIIAGPTLVNRAFALRGQDLAIWERRRVGFKREAKQPTLFTTDADDLRLSRAAKFFIVSNSVFSSSITIGTLMLHYRLRFYKPTIETQGLGFAGLGECYTTTGILNAIPMGTADFSQESDATIKILRVSNLAFSWPTAPSDRFLVSLIWVGATVTAGPSTITLGGCTYHSFVPSSFSGSGFASTAAIVTAELVADADVNTCTMTFGSLTASSWTSLKIAIAKIAVGVTKKRKTIQNVEDEVEQLRRQFEQFKLNSRSEQTTPVPDGSMTRPKTPTLTRVKIREENGDSKYVYIGPDHQIIDVDVEDEPETPIVESTTPVRGRQRL